MYYKVYFILAHTKPRQLKFLIDLLNDGKSIFFIHIDKKVSLTKFDVLNQIENCFIIKNSVKCSWGDYSLVQATLNSLIEINQYMNVKYPNAHYHCIFLSGEDMPLKPNIEIHHFLVNKLSTSFIHHWKLPYDKWWGGGFFRFESFYYFNFIKYPIAHKWINKIIKKFGINSIIPINKIKKDFTDLEIYGGCQWMILSKDLMQSILNLTINKNNNKFNSIFKYVLAPDELYFTTLIYHYKLNTKFNVDNSQTHLAIFKNADANPQYLNVKDIVNNQSNKTLFARKFDESINSDAINFVKNMLKQ